MLARKIVPSSSVSFCCHSILLKYVFVNLRENLASAVTDKSLNLSRSTSETNGLSWRRMFGEL